MSWMPRKNVYGGDLVLSLQSRNRNANGSFSRPKVLSMSQGQIAQLPLSEDAKFCPLCREVNRIATATRELICRSPNPLGSRPH